MSGRRLLVLGGAGYVGSHVVLALRDAGHEAVVLDDLSHGHHDAVAGTPLVVGDAGDGALLRRMLDSGRFDGILHFAAFIEAGESVRAPGKYLLNNAATTFRLLDAIDGRRLPLVLSSTAAVYGEPLRVPIPESHPTRPVNPYGLSKLMAEQALRAHGEAHGQPWVALRYFNAAGADPAGRAGERHQPETHLIPLALQAALGRRDAMTVFGDDWDTPDGTCLRDFVHVADLAAAHLLALEHLWNGGASQAINLGAGRGHSVRETLDAVRRVTDRDFPIRIAPRRPGDPARLIADTDRARALLGWTPSRGDLDTIIADAWRWETRAGPM
ncbi:MAG: UDP-glucose 4-epimerase GalE [Alphaproteobacteria bacterium]|nr:UDP-glucose 4-epimerase GalE [Alphaproteobacteria bacterium]